MKNYIIDDVAREAKVSLSTVSKVLNNYKHIKEETRTRVLDAVKKLNYNPSINARLLAHSALGENKRNDCIGFVVPGGQVDKYNKSKSSNFGELFYSKILSGALEQASKFKLKLIADSVKADYTEIVDLPWMIRDGAIGGLLVVTGTDEKFAYDIVRMDIPAIFVESYPGIKGINTVKVDNVKGAYDAVEYLIESGHKKIGIIAGWLDDPITLERLIGVKMALENHKLAYNGDYVAEGRSIFEGGYEAAENMMKKNYSNPPTAIFAMNDFSAIGAKEALEKKGLKVPDDISIIGFDDIELAAHIKPSLTTMRIPREEMGRIALRRLYELIDNRDSNPVTTLMPVSLIERASVKKIN